MGTFLSKALITRIKALITRIKALITRIKALITRMMGTPSLAVTPVTMQTLGITGPINSRAAVALTLAVPAPRAPPAPPAQVVKVAVAPPRHLPEWEVRAPQTTEVWLAQIPGVARQTAVAPALALP